jgi:prepilin-type processing-associated H-X9-DG protein
MRSGGPHVPPPRSQIQARAYDQPRTGENSMTMSQCARYHGGRITPGGFTLIELCVGVAALAGLFAVVAPAARSTREASLAAHCRQNLERIVQASLVYASEDSAEWVIPVALGDWLTSDRNVAPYGFGGKSGWFDTKPSGNPEFSPFSGGPLYRMGAPDRPLNRILFKTPIAPPLIVQGRSGERFDWTYDTRHDLAVYRCPADSGFPGMHYRVWRDSGLNSYDFFGTSYAASTLFLSDSANAPSWSVTPYAHALSAVPAPSNTLAYMENAGRFGYRARNTSLGQNGCYWPYPEASQTANGWHGAPFRFNVTYVDGHVAEVEMRGYGQPAGQVPCAPQAGSWCDCYAFRTAAWRLDIMPAAWAQTYKIRPADPPAAWDIVE